MMDVTLMESGLLLSQVFLSLTVALIAVRLIRWVGLRVKWEAVSVDGQALRGLPPWARAVIMSLMRLSALASRWVRPSLGIRRDLGVLGFDPRFDDLLFSRLHWTLMILLAICFVVINGIAYLLGSGGLTKGITLISLVMLLLAAVLPRIWLRDRAAGARRAILRSFPTFLDVLALVLESGQNFQSALALSLQRFSSANSEAALGRQLQELSQDIRAGHPKTLALQKLSDRVGLEEMSQFTASIKAADQQGVSVTALLRRQAEQLRLSRALAAERQAMKLPVKLLMPLAVCIFPCTFLVLAFPLAIRLSHSGLF